MRRARAEATFLIIARSSDPAASGLRSAASSAAFILKLRPGQPARPRRESARIGRSGRAAASSAIDVEQPARDDARLGLVHLLQHDHRVHLRGDLAESVGQPLHQGGGRGRPVLGVEPVQLDGLAAGLDDQRLAVGERPALRAGHEVIELHALQGPSSRRSS